MHITYIDIYHIYAHIIKHAVVPERCCRSDSRGARRCQYVYFTHIFNISYICVYILHMHVLSLHTAVTGRCCRSDSSGSRRSQYLYFKKHIYISFIHIYIIHVCIYHICHIITRGSYRALLQKRQQRRTAVRQLFRIPFPLNPLAPWLPQVNVYV